MLGDVAPEGEAIRRVLEGRPDSEPPWTALRNALLSIADPSRDRERMLRISKMMYETPSLRARSIEKHLQRQAQLVPEVRRRLGGGHTDGPWLDVQAQSLVASAIACMDVAGEAWARADGRLSLGELLESAFAAVCGERQHQPCPGLVRGGTEPVRQGPFRWRRSRSGSGR